MTQPSILAVPVITCLNHLVNQSDLIRQQLQSYANETVCFHIEPLIYFYVSITSDGYFKVGINNERSEVTLNMPIELIPRLISGDQTVFHKITILGNQELADHLLNIGKRFQLEIEENLSSVIGDVLAHRVTSIRQRLVQWHLGNMHSLSRIVKEFVTEEQSLVINHKQFQRSDLGIGTLQQQVLLLEEKLNKLISSPP